MSKKILWLGGILSVLVLIGAGCVSVSGGNSAQGPAGIYVTADKGETWSPAVSYPTPAGIKSLAGVNVYKIYLDPSDPDALYLGTRSQGLFYTYDKGASWNAVAPMSGKFIYALAVDPRNKCVIYVSDGPHIFKTIDCSRTWRLVYTEERLTERFVSLAVDYGNSNLVYGALVGGDVLVSRDQGDNWQAVKRFGFELSALASDPMAANRIYVASRNYGLYRSDTAGAGWLELKEPLNSFNEANNFYRLTLHPTQKNSLYWVSKYGILYSTDAGQSWQDIKLLTPPGSVNIYAFAVSPMDSKEMYYVGTILSEKNTAVRSTFYKSLDGGQTWVTKKLPTNTIPVSMYIHPKTGAFYLGFTASF